MYYNKKLHFNQQIIQHDQIAIFFPIPKSLISLYIPKVTLNKYIHIENWCSLFFLIMYILSL